jgi:hypothetical protein
MEEEIFESPDVVSVCEEAGPNLEENPAIETHVIPAQDAFDCFMGKPYIPSEKPSYVTATPLQRFQRIQHELETLNDDLLLLETVFIT